MELWLFWGQRVFLIIYLGSDGVFLKNTFFCSKLPHHSPPHYQNIFCININPFWGPWPQNGGRGKRVSPLTQPLTLNGFIIIYDATPALGMTLHGLCHCSWFRVIINYFRHGTYKLYFNHTWGTVWVEIFYLTTFIRNIRQTPGGQPTTLFSNSLQQ